MIFPRKLLLLYASTANSAIPLIPGYNLWLDATDPNGNGILPSNSSSLPTWVDKSGNNLSPTQNQGAQQPIFNLNRQNGLPGITFNGVAQFLQASNYSALVNTPAFTLFVVCKITGGSGNFRCPISSRAFPASSFQGYWVYAQGNDEWTFITGQIDGNADFIAPGASVVDDQIVLLEATCISGAKEFFVNNLSGTSANTFMPNATRLLRVGAGANEGAANFYFQGDIYEILYYPWVLTPAQINHNKLSLSRKWGVSL